MQYSCPNCRRVFFGTKAEGPCPECGTDLAADHGSPDQADPTMFVSNDIFRGPQAHGQGPSKAPGRPARQAQAGGASSASSTVKERVLAVTSVVLGMLVLGLALGLLFGGTDASAPAGAAANAAGLETRVGELERTLARLDADNRALRGETARLTGANSALTAQKQVLERSLAERREGAGRQAEAGRLTFEALRLVERRAGLEKALELADAALELAPDGPMSAAARRVKARALLGLGRPAGALDAFEGAHDASVSGGEAGDAEALVLAGEACLTRLADRERAGEYYRQAAALEAASPQGLVAQARLLFLNGDWAGAMRKAIKAGKADPSVALAPLVSGEALFGAALQKSGERRRALLEKADALLVRALELDPNSPHACLVRGKLLIEQSRLVAPDQGFGLARFSRQDEAARLLAKAKDLSPRWGEVYVALGALRLERGALRNPGMARALAQEAVKLTARKDATALATLASAHAASGSPAEAAKTAAEALKVDPDNAELRSLLARYRAEAKATSPHRQTPRGP